MSESVHNQWLQCHQSLSCIRDKYPLNSQGRENLSNNWIGGNQQSFGSFFCAMVLCLQKESFLDKCTNIFCSFLLQSISCIAHCTISVTVSMQILLCCCSWHNSNTFTAETLMRETITTPFAKRYKNTEGYSDFLLNSISCQWILFPFWSSTVTTKTHFHELISMSLKASRMLKFR